MLSCLRAFVAIMIYSFGADSFIVFSIVQAGLKLTFASFIS